MGTFWTSPLGTLRSTIDIVITWVVCPGNIRRIVNKKGKKNIVIVIQVDYSQLVGLSRPRMCFTNP